MWRRKRWKGMEVVDLVSRAQFLVDRSEMSRRTELKRVEPGLYRQLETSGVLEWIRFPGVNKAGPGRRRRRWADLSDKELVDYARNFINDNGIPSRAELDRADAGLMSALRVRGVADQVRFPDPDGEGSRQRWRNLTDRELVRRAQAVVDAGRMGTRAEILRKEPLMYGALQWRGLLRRIELYGKRSKGRGGGAGRHSPGTGRKSRGE